MSSGSAYEQFRNRRFFGSLDALRALAVLGVIWHHTAASAFSSSVILGRGPEGVTLFFAISGFLITTLLLREQESRGFISLKNFYIRRSLRIFPLYFSVLALYVVLVLIFESDTERGREFFRNLPYYLTYTSNFAVQLSASGTIFYFAWSLAAEEQFYSTWPWVEKYLNAASRVLLLVLLLLAVAAVRDADTGFSDMIGRYASKGLLTIMPALCFGVLIAHALHRRLYFNLAYAVLGSRWAPLIVLAVAIYMLSLPETGFFTIHFLLAALVLSCVIREDHLFSGIFSLRTVRWMGVVSYGMYLLHMLCYGFLKKIAPLAGVNDPLVYFVATTALTLVVASFSYKYYEAYFLRFKQAYQ